MEHSVLSNYYLIIFLILGFAAMLCLVTSVILTNEANMLEKKLIQSRIGVYNIPQSEYVELYKIVFEKRDKAWKYFKWYIPLFFLCFVLLCLSFPNYP